MRRRTVMNCSKESMSSSKSFSVHCVVLSNLFWQWWCRNRRLSFSTSCGVHLLFSIQASKFLNVGSVYLLINSSRDRDWLVECESLWIWPLELVQYLGLPLFCQNVRICVKERSFNCTTYILGGYLCFSWFLIDTNFLSWRPLFSLSMKANTTKCVR